LKLTSFRIRRYRVFDAEVTIPLSNFTVLTGPNNLGKSTVLRAISLFFNEIGARHRPSYPTRIDRNDRFDRYDPDTDYPKLYEGKPGRRYSTRLSATVEFSSADSQFAQDTLKLSLPPTVTLSLDFLRERDRVRRDLKISAFQKPEDSESFLRWFTSDVRYIYIPANRNVPDFRRSVFSEIVSNSIGKVRKSRQRVQVLQSLYADVRNLIGDVETQLTSDLKHYLPDLKDIKFQLEEPDLLNFISLDDVQIDDGAKTSITQKGDGVKSLFVMSILQFLAKQNYQRNLIFAIEEPEAHLHSSAIYDTKASLRALSSSFQILTSTHSPILVQRDEITANIIIDRAPGNDFACSATVAKSLAQIRNSLGIRPQENLATAEVTIVVEGKTEEGCLGKLLSSVYPALSTPIENGRVRIISAGGASKSVAVLRALARDAASCLVIVDSDQEGLNAFDEVKRSGLINVLDVFQVPARTGCLETEFEDLFPPQLYIDAVATACGCAFDGQMFSDSQTRSGDNKTRMKKWTFIIAELVRNCGKSWDDVEPLAKEALAKALVANVAHASAAASAWLKSVASRAAQNLRDK